MSPMVEGPVPRVPTEEERQHFQEHGWVRLSELIPAEGAATLRAFLESRMEVDGTQSAAEKRDATALVTAGKGLWSTMEMPSAHDEHFHRYVHSPEMGAVGATLLGRPVRFWVDHSLVKPPASAGAQPTPWHQDLPAQPFDRRGQMTVWLALNDMDPEFGTMQFLSGSHREGPLGRPFQQDSVTDQYEHLLRDYEPSPPMALRAGDATVHDGLTVHAAGANRASAARWAHVTVMMDAATLYTGAPHWRTDDRGLTPFEPFDDDAFPILTAA